MMNTSVQREFAMALQEPATSAPVAVSAINKHERDRRFAVHRNNFVVNLVDVLEESFPVTAALVGEAFFREMARERVLADPPRSPVLLDYAHGFSEWVANYDPAVSLGYLPEVVQLEALRIRAYNAKDCVSVEMSVFEVLSSNPELLLTTSVVLNPACEWMKANHAVYSIWHAHQDIDDISEANIGDIDIDEAQAIIVSRRFFDVVAAKLPPGGFTFLNALQGGETFGEAFTQALSSDADANPSSLFSILIEHGAVIAFNSTGATA